MDLGKEFYNAPFRRMLKQEGSQHFSTHGDAKASIVECFNRMLKELMHRSFTARNTRTYLNVLPQLLNEHNQTRHRSIGMAPQDVTDEHEPVVWAKLFGKRLKRRPRPKLKVGDGVHLCKKHRLFKKGYLLGWTEEVFIAGGGHCVLQHPSRRRNDQEKDGHDILMGRGRSGDR